MEGKESERAKLNTLATLLSKSNATAPEVMKHLAEKLSDVLGDAEIGNGDVGLLNDDGLPIIEITEPQPNAATSSRSAIHGSTEPLLVTISSLPIDERERRRLEREQLLELLEKEEEEEAEREAERIRKDARDAAERRIEADPLAKAIIGTPSEKSAVSKPPLQIKYKPPSAASAGPSRKTGTTPTQQKKTVSYADGSVPGKTVDDVMDWGDVVAGRIKRPRQPVTQAKPTVKMEVVERTTSSQSRPSPSRTVDSDDEITGEDASLDGGADDDFTPGVDMDDAMQSREIALEYFKKRDSLAAAAQSGTGIFENIGPLKPRDDWNQEDVPLDATVTGKKQFKTSQFKASRLAELLPKDVTLPGSVQQGKVEGDSLVTSNEDGSESDDMEYGMAGKRIIEQLRSGWVDTANETSGTLPNHQASLPKGSSLNTTDSSRKSASRPVRNPHDAPAHVQNTRKLDKSSGSFPGVGPSPYDTTPRSIAQSSDVVSGPVMRQEVRESGPKAGIPRGAGTPIPPKKVSRFKQERTS